MAESDSKKILSPAVGGGALFHRETGREYTVMARGEGIYLYDEAGKRYIDGTAGAGNVTLGHGCQRIAAAMAAQSQTLAYCFSTFFTNRPALDYAARVAELAPGDLNHVYFVSGGSEGIESAFKLCRQYQLQQGNGSKQLIISRWRAYHGATLGAMAASGNPPLRKAFAPWLPAFPHIAPCYPYRCGFAGCGGQCNLACADQLEQAIVEAGPENVAAFVAEPVVMGGIAAGVAPAGYFARIREICDRYGVLFIADEVITGFGRTGKHFAIEHWGVVPDMIVFGKGASSGYMPLGGVVVRDKVRDSFAAADESFAHVFTYVDNPVAMRVGLEVLDIYAQEDIVGRAARLGAYLHERAQKLRARPSVGQLRGKGLLLGIELVADRDTKTPFAPQQKVAARAGRIALGKGLALAAVSGTADYVAGDDLRFYPPLIIEEGQIDIALEIIDEALAQVERELGTGG